MVVMWWFKGCHSCVTPGVSALSPSPRHDAVEGDKLSGVRPSANRYPLDVWRPASVKRRSMVMSPRSSNCFSIRCTVRSDVQHFSASVLFDGQQKPWSSAMSASASSRTFALGCRRWFHAQCIALMLMALRPRTRRWLARSGKRRRGPAFRSCVWQGEAFSQPRCRRQG